MIGILLGCAIVLLAYVIGFLLDAQDKRLEGVGVSLFFLLGALTGVFAVSIIDAVIK